MIINSQSHKKIHNEHKPKNIYFYRMMFIEMTMTHTAERTHKKIFCFDHPSKNIFTTAATSHHVKNLAEQEHIRHMSSKLMRWFSRFLPTTTHATVPLYFYFAVVLTQNPTLNSHQSWKRSNESFAKDHWWPATYIKYIWTKRNVQSLTKPPRLPPNEAVNFVEQTNYSAYILRENSKLYHHRSFFSLDCS